MAQNQIIKDDNKYIGIDKVAELKGLKSNSSIRKAINNNKYIARKISVKGGYTYEILVSSLEPELQAQLLDEEIKSTQIIPQNNKNHNNQNTFIVEKRKVEAHAKIYLINKFKEFSSRYKKKKDAIKDFLELYNKQSIYLARNGQSAWNRKFGSYIERDYTNIICGKVWVSDHAQIDVACMTKDGNVVFPWVTSWRDYKW